jgi:hypothetical protein
MPCLFAELKKIYHKAAKNNENRDLEEQGFLFHLRIIM